MKKKNVITISVVSVIVIGIIIGIVVWQVTKDDDDDDPTTILPTFTPTTTLTPTTTKIPELNPPNPTEPLPPSESELGIYENAGVSSPAPICSEIGKETLEKGGSVVDSAIATLLCVGVIQSQSMGIGGGFLMVMFNSSTNSSESMIAREMAPAAAHRDMFKGNQEAAQRGPLAVAIPGEIKGYWEMYKRHGILPWKDLFQPTIDLCRNGFNISRLTAGALRSYRNEIKDEPTMAEIFVNPETEEIWEEGDWIKRPKLGETLEIIANSAIGGDELYIGELAKLLAKDIQDMGGIITEEDLKNYYVNWTEPLMTPIHGDFSLHTIPPPGSGMMVSFIMKVLSDYVMKPDSLRKSTEDTVLTYHRISEAYKHAFAKRTLLGDPADQNITEIVKELVWNLTSYDYAMSIRELIDDDVTNNTHEYYGAEYYNPEDHGTSHISIIGPNGDAIAVTSTVNLFFGALIRSVNTGIILNDEMDDFSAPNITNAFGVPPSPNNFIVPGKRPVSSMTPSIFTDFDGKVRLVIGAAGGTRITTQTSMIAMRNLWFGENIKEAIDARRFHHQLYPMVFSYEYGVLDQYVKGLEGKEHETERISGTLATACGVSTTLDGKVNANADYRSSGSVAGY